MHASILITAFGLLPSALAFPSRLPTQYSRRQFGNATQNDTIPIMKPACDLSGISQPSHILKQPTGLELVMIALGEGTQNYTCGTNITAPPSAIGAVAQLFDASCTMAKDPGASTIKAFGTIEESPKSIGAHFFVDNTTPDFDIIGLGNTQTKKAEECLAPKPASDVKWLRLEAKADGSSSAVKQIYRLNTVGGLAPGSCEGKAAGEVVTVDYQAQYWIYTVPETKAQQNETPASTVPSPSWTTTPSSAPVQAYEGAAAALDSPLNSVLSIGLLVTTYLYMYAF
ncbi:hypothetical protein GQ44DRAFT_712900 [Phaeosphaeriaceae sp. PMI808]|nr:hypothetical protein GQ44DRAFT_712900 [Phaeosphaeriaceae sp. PMI808]